MPPPFSFNSSTTSEDTSAVSSDPANEVIVFPVSFAQQRLWLLEQFEPDSSLNNITMSIRLTGKVEVAVLERALNEIISRHESLRTTFNTMDGEVVQLIAPELKLIVETVELADLPEDERDAEVPHLARLEAELPFDLECGPLLRSTLLHLSASEHVLLLTIHHIVSDGWSMGVFFRELATLYGAFIEGQPSPLEELPIQYADFAEWQREWLSGEVLEEQLDYWRKQLAGAPAVLKLPTDRPRPRVQTFRGDHQRFELSSHLTESLKKLSRSEGATLFMTLMASFHALLFRYTGQEKIMIGTGIANRNQPEIEGLIGFFVNMLVIGADLREDPSFQELLQQVREASFGAYAHQDLPFDKLVEELQPERRLGSSPLFQVSLMLQNAPMPELELAGLKLTQMPVVSEIARYDLSLLLRETNQGITGVLEYNTDLFDRATAERMIAHYKILLESAVENPTQRLSTLTLLTEEERRRQLVDWNDTATDYQLDRPVHELIAEQAERTPEVLAVISNERRLTYAELNTQANQLAHYLKALKIGPEGLVGILIDDAVEMAVGVLAALKAGGAFVLFDPASTSEQLSSLLQDVDPQVVLIQEQLRDSLPSDTTAHIVWLESESKVIAAESESKPACNADCEHLACVIHGSASADERKAVMITHRGISNQVHWLQSVYELSESDRVLLDDLSLPWQFLWPLSVGACLVAAPPERHQDGSQLIDLISRHDVTTIHLTSSRLQALLMEPGIEDCLSLSRIIYSGEPLQAELRRTLLDKLPTELDYIYELIETSGAVTHGGHERPGGYELRLPIGRPIANTQVYVLDKHLQTVPIGITGELYIGGAGLLRGFLNHPQLTAERMIPHPASLEPGERLYRTGDLACYRPDGSLELLGRLEHQVERRGVRFQTGEIEIVLNSHPALGRAVVLKNVSGDQPLVAYVQPHPGQSPPLSDLERFLRERLAEYMLPVHLVIMDELPLKTNGDVDFRSLSALAQKGSESAETFVAPRDLVESRLAEIWEGILNVRPINVTRNFFDLGGTSMSAVNLQIQMQEQFGQELPLSALFEDGTIESIASILRRGYSSDVRSPLVPIQPKGSRQPFYFVHAIGGNVLAYFELSRALGMDQPFYAFKARGLNGEQTPLDQLEEVASYYLEALRAQQPQGPYMLGGWSLGGVIAFEMAQQLQRQGQEVALLVLVDSRSPAVIIGSSDRGYSESQLLADFILDMSNTTNKSLDRARVKAEHDAIYNDLKDLDPTAQLQYAWERARNANIVTPNTELKQIGYLWQVFRSNFIALSKYDPQIYPDKIVLFRASEMKEEVETDLTLGWQALSTQPIKVRFIPGNHYTILTKPHVQVLAEGLRNYFDKVLARN